jgi:putative ATP-binding cassette transporter
MSFRRQSAHRSAANSANGPERKSPDERHYLFTKETFGYAMSKETKSSLLGRTKMLVADMWSLIRPYWQSEERWRSGALLLVIVAMNLAMVYLSVLFNEWNNLFYNALQNKDFATFTHQFIRFGMLAAIFLIVAVYRTYLRQMLQIRWRQWLTRRYIGEWLGGQAYYRLQLTGGRTDNPDQRIADDIGNFVGQSLILSLGLLESIVTLASFATILWGLSGSMEIVGVAIPGYMLWVALVYAAIGTWLTHRIGRPLIRLNYQQQQFEADFRFSLVRLREDAEGIALYNGEAAEANSLAGRFGKVVENWWGIMRQQKRLTWFTSGYGQIAIVFPFIVAAPRYFSGALQLGGLMQTASAFGQVQGALSWFIEAYTGLADWKATVDRLVGFERALMDVRRGASRNAVRHGVPSGEPITIDNLDLMLPDGTPLQRGISLKFPPSSRTVVTGPSGCGKSTLFRAINGLWPYWRGSISLPAGERLLFLPQKPYLPIAPLRSVTAYPDPPERYGDERIRDALCDCGLAHLVDRLDEERHWAQQLSPGEQQRLAFARALLLRPNWLFLDEATSALDEMSETALYRLVARLPGTALISIAHRPAVAAFHDRRLDLSKDEAAVDTDSNVIAASLR